MDTYPQPHHPTPRLGLRPPAHYQLVHALAAVLPPPVNDTPEALLARNDAAIDAVAAMLPTNANEAGFAAQCVAARAQADDVLRLIRAHEGDIAVVMRLNAQCAAMMRASQGAYGHLLRAQAARHKREQNSAALNADEWTQHIVTSSMQQALAAGPLPAMPAEAPPAPARAAEPPAPPAAQPLAPAAAQPLASVSEPAPSAEQPPPPAPDPAPLAQPPAPASPPPAEPSALSPEPPPPALAPAPVATHLPAPAAPVPPPAPRRSRPMATPADPDDPPRDLPTEADYYAVVYPNRAREIRRYGGLPPDCTYGPPDDDLVHAIVTGTSPALRALDSQNTATA